MYKKVILDNNIPVVLETTNDVRSICIGIWVKVGSRNEEPSKNGISHFLEHMFFKGTESRTAKSIAVEIDSMGGELNAFTSCESTTFYVKVLDEYMERALDLLTDIFTHSTFPESDIEKEKQIITEEIKMVEDTPSDYVHDLFSKNIWGEGGLGQPVIGKRETVMTFTKEDIINHIMGYYGSENIIVACSGNLNEKVLIERLNNTIGTLKKSPVVKKELFSEFGGGLNIVTKELSESHFCFGLKGIPYGSKERYAMHLLNIILGLGYSSRLFQEIREERGLAYSIYSYHTSYFDTGLWAVYAGTDKQHLREVVDIIISEIRSLSTSITPDELRRAKNQLKGNLMLALESTSGKMMNIARQEIYYGRYFSIKEIIKAVESVTLEEVRTLALRLMDKTNFALTIYGQVREGDFKDLM